MKLLISGLVKFLCGLLLVWFARVIPWEFPDFSVETHKENLFHAQKLLEKKGCLEGVTHRFLLVAQK